MASNYASLTCLRFDFGVPLEDIFPADDIHPRLKNLFYQSYLAVKSSSSSVLSIFRNLRYESFCDQLIFKDNLVKGQVCFEEVISPGIFIWLLRHFLGLLPLPLFPKFTENEKCDWQELAAKCREISNYELDHEISRHLEKLPKCNVILIDYLISFLRRLYSVEEKLSPCGTKRTHKKTLRAITKYFSSALFIRPYRPGFMTKADRSFFSLTYYIISNWPRIVNCKLESRCLRKEEFEYEIYKTEITQLRHIQCQTVLPQPQFDNNENGLTFTIKSNSCCCEIGDNYENKHRNNLECIVELNEQQDFTAEDYHCGSDNLYEIIESCSGDEFNTCIDVLPRRKFTSTPLSNVYLNRKTEFKQLTDSHHEQEYLYDDYDTFSTELFNQIAKECTSSQIKASGEIMRPKEDTLYETPKNNFEEHFTQDIISKSNTLLTDKLDEENAHIRSDAKTVKSGVSIKLVASKFRLLKDIKFTKTNLYNNFVNSARNVKYRKLMTL